MLVDAETGALMSVSHRALRAHQDRSAALTEASAGDAQQGKQSAESEESQQSENNHDDADVAEVAQELFLHQIETATNPSDSLADVGDEVRRTRRSAGTAARAAGAAMVATATPVLGDVDVRVTPKTRYQRIVDEYGEIGRHAIVGGMHIHVDVGGDDEAVGVLDRIRPWLPVILAISANSPFWRGVDTGYASWRAQVWGRWPSAGPAESFGDFAGYRAATQALIDSGAALDPGMLYLDARLAASYPTVEIRVADVCTEVEDVVLVAALCRALVETATRSWRSGEPAPDWRSDLLRAAHWRAARVGMSGRLVDPVRRSLAPARAVVEGLIGHTREALRESGDVEAVEDAVERLLARGAGAARQRAVAEATGSLEAVVSDLRERTEASWHR